MQYDGKVFCNDGWMESLTYYYYTEACGSSVSNYSWCYTPPIVGCTSEYAYSNMEAGCAQTSSNNVGAGLAGSPFASNADAECEAQLEQCRQQINDIIKVGQDYYQCIDDEAAERSLQYEQELERLNSYFDAEEERQNNELCQVQFGDYAYASGTECKCQSGYSWNANQTSCVVDCSAGYIQVFDSCLLPSQYCSSVFGSHVYGISGSETVDGTCFCESGYEWNENKTACVKIEEEPVEETILIESLQLQEVEIILPLEEPESQEQQEEDGVPQIEKDIVVEYLNEEVLNERTETTDSPVLQESEINNEEPTANQEKKTIITRFFEGIKSTLDKIFSLFRH